MAEAGLYLAISTILLRSRLRWRFIEDLVRPGAEQPARTSMDTEQLSRLARAVDRAATLSGGFARCLCRAAAMGHMLRRRGARPCLRFGVHAGPALQAHAWLELGSEKVYDWMGAARDCTRLWTVADAAEKRDPKTVQSDAGN